jgi:hypothetical protein
MALDMRHLEFFCAEEHGGERIAMTFKQRRPGLLHWDYFYECPRCGNVGRAYLKSGRLRIDQRLDGATRRNQAKRRA